MMIGTVFDPASVDMLRNSPRLAEMREPFKAIAAGKPEQEVWALTGRISTKLNAIERDKLPDLVRAELKRRGY